MMKDAMDTYKTINVTDAIDLIKTGKVILADIRDRESYTKSHIPDAVHLTQDNLEEFKNNSGPDKIIILYCYHGSKMRQVCICHLTFNINISIYIPDIYIRCYVK